MMKNILKKYYLLFIFIILLPVFIILDNFQENDIKYEYSKFDKSIVQGKLIKVDRYSMGTKLEINNKVLYYFRDQSVYEKQVPKDKWLYDIAERGDSIYKASYSDTLFLFKKNGEKYFFVFDRSDLYWD